MRITIKELFLFIDKLISESDILPDLDRDNFIKLIWEMSSKLDNTTLNKSYEFNDTGIENALGRIGTLDSTELIIIPSKEPSEESKAIYFDGIVYLPQNQKIDNFIDNLLEFIEGNNWLAMLGASQTMPGTFLRIANDTGLKTYFNESEELEEISERDFLAEYNNERNPLAELESYITEDSDFGPFDFNPEDFEEYDDDFDDEDDDEDYF